MTAAQLDSVFSALADPTRRAILTRLANGEATVSELAEPFNVTLPAISKHVKVLERAGLVERGRQAQRRPCRLRPDPLREALGWLAGHSEFWDGSFDRLSEHLNAIQREERA